MSKATRVVPVEVIVSPYIKGTEAPNYYLVLGESDGFIWGFRPLAVAVPAKDSVPTNGQTTRFRIVPKNAAAVKAFKGALSILNFEERNYADGEVSHFSTVVSDSSAFAVKVAKLLSLTACF